MLQCLHGSVAHVLATVLQAQQGTGRLGFVTGLIQQEKLPGFERLLFRATRGNMFLRTTAVGAVKVGARSRQQ